MVEIECILVSREMGKKKFTYKLTSDGNDITLEADKSLTFDEITDKIKEKDNVQH